MGDIKEENTDNKYFLGLNDMFSLHFRVITEMLTLKRILVFVNSS